jgi:hypothetical protein
MVQATGGTASWCDRFLDALVVLLATWTLAYHVCVVVRLGTTVALVLWLVLLAATLAALRRLSDQPDPTPHAADPAGPVAHRVPDRVLVGVTLAAAAVAAVAVAVSAWWVLVWPSWVVAALSGTTWAWRRLAARPSATSAREAPEPSTSDSGWTSAGVLAWALGLGLLSMWTQRPNPDDLFYLNVSQWVAGHGDFPVKDTLFSDLAYPMANWPPVASYEGLVGTVARLTGAYAATIEYVVVTPLATFLAVLALWRLLRAWRVGHLFWVLSTALVFLLFDGSSSYASPGNLFLTRLWQGKVVLLCVLVPVLLVYALRYVERPSRRRLTALALGGVASVGLTTTGIFLVPLLALAGMAPLVRRDRRRALVGFAALAGYPLAAGIVTFALGGRSADDFGARRLYRFDADWIGNQLLLTELVGLVVVLALLLAALLVPHPAARLTSGLLTLLTGYVFIPGAMRLSYDLTGLGPTLWRISWAAAIAALVGVLAVEGGRRVLAHVLPAPAWRPRAPVVSALVVMALLAAFGPPTLSEDTGTVFRSPFHWQRSYSSRSVTSHILGVSRPGDLVLAPESLSITIAVTSTDVKTVAPRDYYMEYLQDDPSFHYAERLALVEYVNDDSPAALPGLGHDLAVLGVDVACTHLEDADRSAALERAGFRPFLTSTYYRCLRRG